ncbi:MAG: alpha/beta hydrolase, partial [Myxococcota bacterium]|nr:alpha/beta hydrolase [Myxococcota bacterium]
MRYLFLPVLLLVLVIGGIFFGERVIESLVFHPVAGSEIQPERLGLQGEGVFLETEDGVRIHAFWLPVEKATQAILFLHGNGGNASFALPSASLFLRLGASVLVLDYRGYGLSEGVPTEEGVYRDAQAGLAYLMEVQ